MTHQQQKALAKAFILLEDQFDHVLVVVSDKEEPGKYVPADPLVCWAGGLIVAKHLAGDAAKKLDYRRRTRSPPEVSEAVMRDIVKEQRKCPKQR